LLLGCLVLGATSASATAAAAEPVDRTSAHRAVQAWRQLVRDEVRGRHVARLRLAAYRRSIARRCPGAFRGLAETSPENLKADVVRNVVGEAAWDTILVAQRPLRPAFTRFARRMIRLRWSSSATADGVRASVRYVQSQLRMTPTDICATARAIASDPARTPGAALRLLSDTEPPEIPFLVQINEHLQTLASPHDRRQLARLVRRSDFGEGEALLRSIAKTDVLVKKTLGITPLEDLLVADSAAKSDARVAVAWIESCYTDREDYRECRKPSDFDGLPYGPARGQVEVTAAGRDTYTIVAHSRTGNDFAISRNSEGIVSRSCSRPGVLECQPGGRW
jgi:hypothetical protein